MSLLFPLVVASLAALPLPSKPLAVSALTSSPPALSALTPSPLASAGVTMTLAPASTEVQVRLVVPAWEGDEARAQLLRKSGGEHILAAGYFGTTDLRVTILGGPAPDLDGDACRNGVLGDRLLGMGTADVAGFATAKTIRFLNAPYREVDRHAFLLGANAMVHVQVIALEKEDPEVFGDAGFEAILASARFAVLRRTAWDDMPERYLQLSHEAALRADGVDWLRDLAAAEDADWVTKLAAAEHAHAQRSTADYVIELDRAVRAELSAKTERTRAEDAGLLLAEDGLGLALLRANDPKAAAPHLEAAVALAARFGEHAAASVGLSVACLRAAHKDVDGVVALLTAAEAVDPALRYRLQKEPLLDPVRADPRAAELLKIVLKSRTSRQIGR